jgi:hypothetical protein
VILALVNHLTLQDAKSFFRDLLYLSRGHLYPNLLLNKLINLLARPDQNNFCFDDVDLFGSESICCHIICQSTLPVNLHGVMDV